MVIDNDGDAEIYSPTGECNYKLATTPIRKNNPVLIFVNNRIVACAGQQNCWKYHIQNDTWVNFTQAPFRAEYQPGVVYQNKLYVIDTSNAHVMDLENGNWSSWPMPPNKFGSAHFLVGWRDSIILFGGHNNKRGVQVYDIRNQTWKVQNSSNVPMDITWMSCLLVKQDQVLLSGSDSGGFYNSAAKYNPRADTWNKLADSGLSHRGSRLVKLGRRVFSLGGYDIDFVEELNLANNTWTNIETKLINNYKGYHSALALPSWLFAHLPGGCKGVK
jgi:hypothetical protein